ncbi:MAG: Protein YidD [Pseudonocardiales bacterium]|nr:Protein YidD [Pseudonocardiales bacterium]
MSPSRSLAARGCLRLVAFYRGLVSPMLPPTCRYAPTCSEYAMTAIERFGAGRGSWLALRRLLRCGPWHHGGYDPVPEQPDRPGSTEPHSPLSERITARELEHQP